jgi:hypothetical protein
MRVSLRVALVFAACLFSVWTIVAQETETTSFIEYEVISDTANLRADPSTSASIAGRAVKGDILRGYAEQETDGWYKIQLADGTDAYIADFLVQRAPDRLYPIDQEPIFVAEGKGAEIVDTMEFPAGLYRLDYRVTGDGDVHIEVSPIEGTCIGVSTRSNFFESRTEGSLAIVSRGCEAVIEVNGTRGEWHIEIRSSYIRGEADNENLIVVEEEVTISSAGYQTTAPTRLEKGLYAVEVTAQADSIMVKALPLESDCDREMVLYEGDVFVSEITGSGTYQVDKSCTVMWETAMADDGESWTLTIRKLR